MGDIQGVVLANTAPDDPWYCESISLRTEDGAMFPFKVKRWVGLPYAQQISVSSKASDIDMAPQDVECHTRAADLFNE